MSEFIAQERAYHSQTLMRIAREYHELRVIHLLRSRPSLRGILEDMNFQLLLNLKRALEGSKAYGPERIGVSDIVFSDDLVKRRALLSATDQNTLVNEIVEKPDDKKQKTAGTTNINSLRTLYSHFDPSLEIIVETLQTFNWLDLPDVFDYAVIEVSLGHLTNILKARGIPEAIAASFNRSLSRPLAEPVDLEQALLLFFHRARVNFEDFALRRREEHVYGMAIRREAALSPTDEVNQLILACAHQIEIVTQVHAAGGATSEQAAAFAPSLGIPPEQVTADHIVAAAAPQIADLRRKLLEKLGVAGAGGQPFDYKAAQLADGRKRLEMIAQHLTQAGVDLQKEPPKIKKD